MSEHHSSGTVPLPTDTIRTLEVKILEALTGTGGGGAGQLEYSEGSGAPVAAPAAPTAPAIYRNKSDGTIYWWDVTSHTWQ